MHKKNIAHRDLKPDNLLLMDKNDDTTVKIADLGFAKKVLQPFGLKTLCGTASYVAPEVLDVNQRGYDTKAE
jgi:calcium/calmodulin-dependent protein kinase I